METRIKKATSLKEYDNIIFTYYIFHYYWNARDPILFVDVL